MNQAPRGRRALRGAPILLGGEPPNTPAFGFPFLALCMGRNPHTGTNPFAGGPIDGLQTNWRPVVGREVVSHLTQ